MNFPGKKVKINSVLGYNMQNVHNIPLRHFRKVVTFAAHFKIQRIMTTREQIKMQSINFCYMNYLLDALQSKLVTMNGTFIKELVKDDNDTILAIVQDGSTIPAIDIEPEQSTNDIQLWINNNPALHEKVMLLMEG